MEQDNEQKVPVSPLHLFSAGSSLVLPGSGQLLQGRPEAVAHLLFYALAWFNLTLICGGTSDFWTWDGFFFLKIGKGVFWVALFFSLFPLLMILFSVLDAATWKKGYGSLLHKHVVRLGITIVALTVLLVIVLPSISAAREAARRVACVNNLKRIALALHNYYEDRQCFPPAYTVDEQGKPLHSWRVLVLPYLEEEDLYKKIRLDEPWDSEHNRRFHNHPLPIYRCPSTDLRGLARRLYPKLKVAETCFYSVVLGENTFFLGKETTTLNPDVDRTSETILLVERLMPVCWMDPNNEIRFENAAMGVNCNYLGIGSSHPGGANVAFADASVRFMPESIEPELFRSLLTRGKTEFKWEHDVASAQPTPKPEKRFEKFCTCRGRPDTSKNTCLCSCLTHEEK